MSLEDAMPTSADRTVVSRDGTVIAVREYGSPPGSTVPGPTAPGATVPGPTAPGSTAVEPAGPGPDGSRAVAAAPSIADLVRGQPETDDADDASAAPDADGPRTAAATAAAPDAASDPRPSLVLVGSVFDDIGSPHLTALADRLVDRFRVVLFDRRGRGASGDTAPWAREREVEDLAAVVGSLGDGPVHALGLCTGAGLVLQGLGAGVGIDRALVYEPPYRAAVEPDSDDLTFAMRLDEMVSAGRRSSALRSFLVRVLGVPLAQVTAMRLRPAAWRRMLRVAPMLSREWRMMTGLGIPERLFGSIGVPVLVAAGTDSADWLKLAARALVEAVPGSEHTVLIGQGHLATPDAIAAAARAFLLR